MNIRQKVKMYKRLAERNKEKAKMWDDHIKGEMYKRTVKRYGTIETLKVAKYWDDRIPEDFVKNQIAQEFSKCLLQEGYINFEISDNYNEYNMMKRVIGTIKIAKVGEDHEI